MLQCAVWTWYHKLLGSYYRHLPWRSKNHQPQKHILTPHQSIKTLLERGTSLHCQRGSNHTSLDGLLQNIIQFDGNARPFEVLVSCMNAWICLLRDLGVNTNEYIKQEMKLQAGRSHDLGLGIFMEARFDEHKTPHIWAVFQGPEEKGKNEFVDHISKCQRWSQWQQKYAIPKRPDPVRMSVDETEIILVNGCVTNHSEPVLTLEENNMRASSQKMVPSYFTRLRCKTWRSLRFLARYRYEFSLYAFVLTWVLGWQFLTQFYFTLSFYLILKLLQDFT